MEKYNTKDALGKEIVMGNHYGYSQSSNGHTHIKIGNALKFTPKGLLTLKVYESRSSLYNDEFNRESFEVSSISVKPAMLFPVN